MKPSRRLTLERLEDRQLLNVGVSDDLGLDEPFVPDNQVTGTAPAAVNDASLLAVSGTSDPGSDNGVGTFDDSAANPGIVSAQDGSTKNPVNIGGTLYFAASRSDVGSELWKSDGTAAGVTLVMDIRPGPSSSSPQNLTVVNGKLYFTAFTPQNGRVVWRSDGTPAGTVPVKGLGVGVLGRWSQRGLQHSGRLSVKAGTMPDGSISTPADPNPISGDQSKPAPSDSTSAPVRMPVDTGAQVTLLLAATSPANAEGPPQPGETTDPAVLGLEESPSIDTQSAEWTIGPVSPELGTEDNTIASFVPQSVEPSASQISPDAPRQLVGTEFASVIDSGPGQGAYAATNSAQDGGPGVGRIAGAGDKQGGGSARSKDTVVFGLDINLGATHTAANPGRAAVHGYQLDEIAARELAAALMQGVVQLDGGDRFPGGSASGTAATANPVLRDHGSSVASRSALSQTAGALFVTTYGYGDGGVSWQAEAAATSSAPGNGVDASSRVDLADTPSAAVGGLTFFFGGFDSTKVLGSGQRAAGATLFVQDAHSGASSSSDSGVGGTGTLWGLLFSYALVLPFGPKRHQPTIMLAEGDEATRDSMTLLLVREGYLVLPAATAHDALGVLRAPIQPIDVVLLDTHLPDVNGIQLCQRLRELYPALPVLVCTGEAEPAEVAQLLKLGVQHYLRKPIVLNELLTTVRSLLR
jgi:ELWxxDGT repeat protein